jgi:hypothetical protein
MQLSGIKISQKKELEILNHALKFTKYDFAIGHLDYIARRYGKKINLYHDNYILYKIINRTKFSKKINVEVQKIDLKFIDNVIKKGPAIVYLDSYYLWNIVHFPHFIIVLEKIGNRYRIFEPWDGKIKKISSKMVSKAIISLRNHLRFCPQVIQFQSQ